MAQNQKESIDYALEARRFLRIQAHRYLSSRPQKRFSGPSEKDAVIAMIRDAWVELRSSRRLEGLSLEGRVALYCTTIIVFPGFVADSGEKCLVVDFRKKSLIGRCRHRVDD